MAILMVERVMGLEPTTFCLGSKRSTAELHPRAAWIIPPFFWIGQLFIRADKAAQANLTGQLVRR